MMTKEAMIREIMIVNSKTITKETMIVTIETMTKETMNDDD